MRILVLGSGVVGVAAAWYLSEAGHEVTVVDRQPAAGMETSFANAGQVSPGLAAPFAAPSTPWRTLGWLFTRHRPVVLRPRADPALAAWLARFLLNCNGAAYARNKRRMVALAMYSRDCLHALRAATGLHYDEGQRGLLQLFRTQQQMDRAAGDMRVLDALGVPYRLLDRAGCAAAEPALARAPARLAGGLLLPGDETGDAHLFTQRLAALAAARGVGFRHGVPLRALLSDGDRVTGVAAEDGVLTADAYVAALGSYTPALLRTLDLALPVYPVKGYSLTVPITDADAAPVSTVVDESYKTAVTRLGTRMRVAGTAELAGHDLRLREGRRRALLRVARDLYPGAGDAAAGTFWCGLRPMTPDGPPVIGATRYRNLYLDTGHGTLGWTMACGSGRLLADLIGGRRPALDPSAYALSRFG